jgi:hypothetical protein
MKKSSSFFELDDFSYSLLHAAPPATNVAARREIRSNTVSAGSALRIAHTDHRGVPVAPGGLLYDIHLSSALENLHRHRSLLSRKVDHRADATGSTLVAADLHNRGTGRIRLNPDLTIDAAGPIENLLPRPILPLLVLSGISLLGRNGCGLAVLRARHSCAECHCKRNRGKRNQPCG